MIEAVVFDVGETLIDETRAWTAWADHLGVPALTFLGVLGGAIQRGEDHRTPFRVFAPGLDLRAAAAAREATGETVDVLAADLYPDALPCLEALSGAGYRVGVVGNQPARTDALFEALGVPLALVASSASLGVEKPDPAFFRAIAERLDLPTAAIAYVGDRVDNDVRPAADAGMAAIFLRRGPWAWIQAPELDPPEATAVIGSLIELPAVLAGLR